MVGKLMQVIKHIKQICTKLLNFIKAYLKFGRKV